MEADLIYEKYVEVQRKRKSLEAEARRLEKEEQVLEAQIKKALLPLEDKEYEGTDFLINMEPATKPKATDWFLVHNYMVNEDGMDLVEKRLSKKAVQARWDDGIEIPGVVKFTEYKLIVTNSSES